MAIATGVAAMSGSYWLSESVDNSNALSTASSDEQIPVTQVDDGVDETNVAALFEAITSHLDAADVTADTVVEECLRGVTNRFNSAMAHAP